MVVPAWGKGNAHNAPGSSDKFVELSRKSAQAHAAASAAMDSQKDSKILDRINVSALDSDRKKHALKNTRAALRLAQRGVDPLTDSTFQSCDVCRSKPGARVHLFLCSQRERKPKGLEKDIQLRAFQDIAHYLAECRQILSQQVRTHLHAPLPSTLGCRSGMCVVSLCLTLLPCCSQAPLADDGSDRLSAAGSSSIDDAGAGQEMCHVQIARHGGCASSCRAE